MEIVTTYLDIEKVRFGDRLGFVIDVGESVVKIEHTLIFDPAAGRKMH
jgi:LytS/YehU family sensor histidine kinase